MLFSLNWLKELCPDDGSAQDLARILTDRGLTVDSVEPRGEDWALEVDVPANRPDCLGHLGLARELSAGLGRPLLPTPAEGRDQGDSVDRQLTLAIDAPELCPRYTARLVRGVRVGPSPGWVAERLETCGLRSINNVVDASNLVLLECGHPIHFFDYETLAAPPGENLPRIGVRLARPGDRLATLDGVDRPLDDRTLLITDGRRPVALAGIMGGAQTEIGPSTNRVLIEAAGFEPRGIRHTSRRLGLQTDASFRFERGIDSQGVVAAQQLAVRLLVQLASGSAAPGMLDSSPLPYEPARLKLRHDQLRRLLGYQPETAAVRESLDALGLRPTPDGDDASGILVPSYRIDLEREADLVEEVARHLGYDRIPTSPASQQEGGSQRGRVTALQEAGRDLLCGLGFHEALGYAMVAEGEDERFVPRNAPPPMPLSNPIAETMGFLRRSILAGLLRAADLNLRRGQLDVRLFELGHTFLARGPAELPHEPHRLGLAWSGSACPRHWDGDPRPVNLYDLLGIVERLLAGLAPDLRTRREHGAASGFHPGQSAVFRLDDGTSVAWCGALHPELQERFDHPLFLAEIDLEPLARAATSVSQYHGLSRFPAAARDLSLVLPQGVFFSDVEQKLRSVASPAPVRFDALDRYTGPPLEDGQISLTVRFTLQPVERTLTDAETDGYRQKLVEALESGLGVGIR